MPSLEPVDPTFATTAPRVITVDHLVEAPVATVWAVVTDNPGWVDWFPTMSSSENTSNPTTGIGSTRTVKVGALRAEEQFVGWEPEELWAFTITKTNLPMAKRFLEQLEFTPDSDKTRVRYTGAYEPHPSVRPIAGVIDKQIRATWTNGLAGLAEVAAAR